MAGELKMETVIQAVMLVLLLFIAWKVWKMSSEKFDDGYLGAGLGESNVIYTSGATMRRLAQEFSQPGQGRYMIVHNAELPPAERKQNEMYVQVIPAQGGKVLHEWE